MNQSSVFASDDDVPSPEPCRSSEPLPSTENAASDRSILLFLIVLIIGIYTSVGLHVYAMFRKPKPMEPALVQLAILDRLQKSGEKAQQLIEEGKHFEAGLLFSDLAAANRVLLPELDKPVAVEPSVLEQTALWEFRRAGSDLAYREYLELRYPQWSP